MQSPRPLLATDASQRTCLRRQRVGLQRWCHARNGAFAVERPAHHNEPLNRAHSSHGWRDGRCVAPFRRAQCQLPLTTALHLDGSLQISTGCLQPGQPVVVEASRRYGRRVSCAADGDDPEQRLHPASQRHGAVAPKARFGSAGRGVKTELGSLFRSITEGRACPHGKVASVSATAKHTVPPLHGLCPAAAPLCTAGEVCFSRRTLNLYSARAAGPCA